MRQTRLLKTLSVLALALFVGGAPAAFAQPGEGGEAGVARPGGGGPGGGGRGGFQRMDANNDGKISQDEYRGPNFAQLDTNNDGSLSEDELQAGRQRGGGGMARMMERLKEQLKATDEEWTVIEPRIQKVNEAQAKIRPGFGGGFAIGRGGQGGRGQGGPAANAMPEAEALRAVLDNESASADEIKSKLEAYRTARKKAEAELKTAREELLVVLTPRQEAVLVSFGMLD